MKQETNLKVALIGNPNCGKSTLFNVLTGLKQSTANFPGATVEKKIGSFTTQNISVEVVDLPGAYSLNPKSPDEKIAVDVLLNSSHPDHPDLTVFIADASNLKRSLFLASQIIDKKIPLLIALNMMDVVEKKGMEVNAQLLSEKLGVKIIPISARQARGIDNLKKNLLEEISIPKKEIVPKEFLKEKNDAQQTIERYRIITNILEGCIGTSQKAESQFTSRTDKILTHKIWGFAIFLLVLLAIFQSIFFIAKFPMEEIESLFIFFSRWGTQHLPKGELSDLLVNGILSGLSGVVVFIPQIALLFFFIVILEDTGYMARVSFIMDRVMRKFGLNGRSVIPLLSGVACAVPAIMSARTISNRKERLITIMVTPLMSCSARLPVYTLLIALVIPSGTSYGFFNLQGAVLMALYLIGFLAALGSALVMKYLLKSTERSFFIMELPPYRSPRWKNVGLTIIDRVKVFLFDAGKVIIAISIILWFLAAHASGNKFQEIEKKYSQQIQNSEFRVQNSKSKTESSEKKNSAMNDTAVLIASEKLQASFAGQLGKWIEPAIAPLGFDWKIGIALITSFAAREVFVGTMATIYSAGDANNTQSIRAKMSAEINPQTNQPLYSLAVGLSLMIFYAFAMQCMSTLAVVYRETQRWKWPVIQFLYMGALAYLGSFVVYNLFK